MKTKIKIAVVAIIGVSLSTKAQVQEKIKTNVGDKNDFIYTNGSISLGDQIYTGSVLNILKKPADNEAHLFIGNSKAETFSGVVSSRLSFAGTGIQHAGFAWVPSAMNSYGEGKFHLSFGGYQNPMKNAIKFTFQSNGRFGMGTTNPEAKLQINDEGTSDVTTLQLNNRMKFRGDGVFTWGNTADHGLLSWEASKTIVGAQSTKDLSLFANGTEKMIIKTNGNVGVGTTTTGPHKLAVEGSIGAREIKVEGSGWSDFVFENTYNLPSLQEVEAYIKAKGHLKDIPSAKEVEKNGFYLGEMDAKLLQKIEELTLYTIEQEKKLQSQDEEIELLKGQQAKIQKLEKENKVLKALLEKVNRLEKLIEEK
ncbi:hypothetical protein [Tenacibaculum discolor]|uniref:hypothetical protein n=1 Tax=Tenacibaculum discolor TaxID=361581 RepID=UPI003F7A3476